MNKKFIFRVVLALTLGMCAATAVISQSRALMGIEKPVAMRSVPQADDPQWFTDTNKQFLPLAMRVWEVGYDTYDGINSYTDDFTVRGGNLKFNVHWSDFEPSQGNFQTLSNISDTVSYFREQVPYGKIIVNFKNAPTWAALWPDYESSRPKETHFVSYANAANVLISTVVPWGIELGNEPAVNCPTDAAPPPNGLNADGHFGCWVPTAAAGENQATVQYRAGQRYGQAMATAYKIIKTAHPDTNVIVGAIDGINYADPGSAGKYTFVEGMMSIPYPYGAPADYYSFHDYIYDNIGITNTIADIEKYSEDTGGKPVILSEVAVVWDHYMNGFGTLENGGRTPSSSFKNDQEQLFDKIFTYLQENGSRLKMFFWFTLVNTGWRHTDMVYHDWVDGQGYLVGHTPVPVYCAYATAVSDGSNDVDSWDEGCISAEERVWPGFSTPTPTNTPTMTPTPTNTPNPYP